MNQRLREAVILWDVQNFLSLIHEDPDIIDQTVLKSSDSILHLASEFGHEELVLEILKLRPKMASKLNLKMETPLFEACREGRVEIMKILLGINPCSVYQMNQQNKRPLFAACERGRYDVVMHMLLNFQRLLTLERDGFTTSLHVAASWEHTHIVQEILNQHLDFAWRKNVRGCCPLHLACSKGHVDVAKQFLELDQSLTSLQDDDGRTPLHWAVIKGRVDIVREILSKSLEAAAMKTKYGKTVLHLAVKYNQYEALRYLTETLNINKLVNKPDNDSSNILHLAAGGKLTNMVLYILKLGINVNSLNHDGYTAFAIVESDGSNISAPLIVPALRQAGARSCNQLIPVSQDIQQKRQKSMLNKPSTMSNLQFSSQTYHRQRYCCQKRITDSENEGLLSGRNKVPIVAVLIATITFAAGINPPGGYNQETGKAMPGEHISFKVFMVCHILALFVSLGTVMVFIGIIPLRPEPMCKLLSVTHISLWASMLLMAVSYLCATWAIMPHNSNTRWALVTLFSIGGVCTITFLFGLLALMNSCRKIKGKLRSSLYCASRYTASHWATEETSRLYAL
ncbi:putative Ankyrin repeat family protein [Quillaja saponaria]|uniref:Ankyrin repeat family protein n=1 Tax=Quillaja saponaria TaxID=32244 RepID=A0AAD7LIH9_QUISA|nr:putative Ankyrin repeat family protein [Quillaja saponaria]